MTGDYIPERGDLVWVDLDVRAGPGRRAALVVSPLEYNRRIGLAQLCPVTSRVKGYPFEVLLPPGRGVEGVVLADQVRNLDWRERGAEKISRVPAAVINEVTAKIAALLGPLRA